jgi:osmoprotectant transport system substrate-binding protein
MIHSPKRRRVRALAALAVVGALALTACSDNKSDSDGASGVASGTGSGTASETIRISSQDFAEQKTLAQVYGQFLEAKGFKVDVQDPIGTRTQIYSALKADKVDLVLDYQGSAVTELKGTSDADAEKTYAELQKLLGPLDLEAGAMSEAADANALVALKSWADDNNVTTISDLAGVDGDLTLGGNPECAERPDCLAGYNDPEVYGLSLKFTPVDYGPPLVAALESDTIQVAQYGTTAPEISTDKIVVLDDDKGLQSSENVVPVFRAAVSTEDLVKALDELSAAITTKDLAGWNQSTDVDKEDPADVAQAWLEDQGLI